MEMEAIGRIKMIWYVKKVKNKNSTDLLWNYIGSWHGRTAG